MYSYAKCFIVILIFISKGLTEPDSVPIDEQEIIALGENNNLAPGEGDDVPLNDEEELNEPGLSNNNDYGPENGPVNEENYEYGEDVAGNYPAYDYDGGYYDAQLPGSSEMLDRNMQEMGFDLSYQEMMKLKLWPDGFIPYYIDVHSFSDKVMRDKIRSFLSSVNSLTALNFVELPSPPLDNSRWVFFVNRRGLLGCADHSIRNFTNLGVQQVVLGYHCMSTEGELAEAVLSIAGVPAQHNAPDRDYYVKIKEENIIPEKKYLFQKLYDTDWLFHDVAYDFHSAGHFHSYKHSVNGRATIVPQEKAGNTQINLGESTVLSASDILKIRMLYNYIVKKKMLQVPDCSKLFEPGKKFGQYKPDESYLVPRPKPWQYAGESTTAPIGEFQQNEQQGKPMPNQNSSVAESEEYTGIIDPGNGYNYVNPHEPAIPNARIEPDVSDNLNRENYQNNNGRTPNIIHLGQLPIVQLGSPKKISQKKASESKPDLLAALSDYQTDDEKYILKGKGSRHKEYQGLKQQLKFKVPG